MIWSTLYKRPCNLTAESGQRRIYAPSAYAVVRDLPVVPMVMSEAARLAVYHPICWMKQPEPDDAGLELVALRTLLSEGSGQPAEARRAAAALPLVLQAFPLIIRKENDPGPVRLEDAFADTPSDVGATLLTAEGKPSRGAMQRLAIADGFARERALSRALTNLLAEAGLMEPWPLQFDLGGGIQISRSDLFVVDFAALRSGAGRRLRHELGQDGLRFLMLHRISLFRVSALLNAARRHVAEQVAQPKRPDHRADALMAVLA
jgi:SapC